MNEVNKKLPVSQLGVFGLQHVLMLYIGSISASLTVGKAIGLSTAELAFLVSANALCAGIATLIQSFGIGKKIGLGMPAMTGVTVMAATAVTAIATEYDLATVAGSVIVTGILCILLAPLFGKITKLFPPMVRGLVMVVSGLTLIYVAVGWVAGTAGTETYGLPSNYLLAVIVVAVILAVHKFCTGFIRNIAPLLGLVVGLLVAAVLGKVSFAEVATAPWIGFTTPFFFGMPKFVLAPILSLTLIMLVIMGESVAVYMALYEICEVPVEKDSITKGLIGNGVAVIFSGIFNSYLFTTFCQNLGLVDLTKVKSKFTTVAGGLILIAISLFPKLGTIVALIPNPVLGGVGLFVFCSIIVTGMKTCGPELNKGNNTTIAILSIAIGLGCKIISITKGFAAFPSAVAIFLNDGIIMGCLAAVLLNLFFNGLKGDSLTENK